ncbi:MAG: DUF3267 domain-containing protein [Thermomicrobiaceae bacterium]
MTPGDSGLRTDSKDTSQQHEGEYWEPSGIVTTMWVSLSIVLGVLAFLLLGLLYTLLGRLPENESEILNWPAIAGLTVTMLVVHQLIHVAVARSIGGSPRVNVDVVQLIFPVIYCRIAGQRFSRTGFLVYLLTPLALPTVVGVMIMPVDERMVWMIIPLTANAALSLRDLWMAWVVWMLPNGSSVKAERDGLQIFRPT